MHEFLKRSGRWLSVGWFWPLVLLALPGCFLSAGGLPPDNTFEPGDEPRTNAVMCDIPQVPDTFTIALPFPCATPDEIAMGLASTRGAVALSLGDTNTIKLDYSQEAFTQCGAGKPRRIDVFDPFPNGTAICLNCDQQVGNGKKYTDPSAVCVAKCKELVDASGATPEGGIDAFCEANAKVSTNFDSTMCFHDVCLSGGIPMSPFPDPRLPPEDLSWIDPAPNDGTIVIPPFQNNNVSFTGPGNGNFSAGAASGQLITEGDAWVEFEAGETGVSHAIGVRTSCEKILTDCPDTDGTLGDLPLVLNLNVDNATRVEAGPNVLATSSNYAAGVRFRIYVSDNHDGTANISFARLTSTCSPGVPCSENVFYTHPFGTGPAYPLRVDVSFARRTQV